VITYFVHAASIDTDRQVRSGWNDAPLSERGRDQAADLRDAIADMAFDRVYCSDLSRVTETVDIAFRGCAVSVDTRLREMNYGELNGELSSRFPRDDRWCIDNRFPGGENCYDVEARIRAFLDDCARPFENGAVVSHRFPQLALEVILNGYRWMEAIESDWRAIGAWQAGWRYYLVEER